MRRATSSGVFLRSCLAIIVGIVVVVLLSTGTDLLMYRSGIFPSAGKPMLNSLLLLATVYRTVYGVLGSYLSARLAPNHPIRHAMALGILGLTVSILGVIVQWNAVPVSERWYPIALVVLALPGAWVGGILYERTKQKAA